MRAHTLSIALALLVSSPALANTTEPCGCPFASTEQVGQNDQALLPNGGATLHAQPELVMPDTQADVVTGPIHHADAKKFEQRGVTKPQPRVVKAGCCDQGYNTRTLWWLLPIALAAGLAWRFLKFRNTEQPA